MYLLFVSATYGSIRPDVSSLPIPADGPCSVGERKCTCFEVPAVMVAGDNAVLTFTRKHHGNPRSRKSVSVILGHSASGKGA